MLTSAYQPRLSRFTPNEMWIVPAVYGDLPPPVQALVASYHGLSTAGALRTVCWHYRTTYDSEPVALDLVNQISQQAHHHNRLPYLITGGIRYLSDTLVRFSDNHSIVGSVCNALTNIVYQNTQNRSVVERLPLVEQLFTVIRSNPDLPAHTVYRILNLLGNILLPKHRFMKHRVRLSQYQDLVRLAQRYPTQANITEALLRLVRNSTLGRFPFDQQIAQAYLQAGADTMAWQCLTDSTQGKKIRGHAIMALWHMYQNCPEKTSDITRHQLDQLLHYLRQSQQVSIQMCHQAAPRADAQTQQALVKGLVNLLRMVVPHHPYHLLADRLAEVLQDLCHPSIYRWCTDAPPRLVIQTNLIKRVLELHTTGQGDSTQTNRQFPRAYSWLQQAS